jgi:uncharacterized protein YkwD
VRGRPALRLAALAAAGLMALELGFRALAGPVGLDRGRLARFREFVRRGGEAAQYVPRPHVLYVRAPGPQVNALGFLEREVEVDKPAGTLRIACLGSSTTEGGNAAQREGSYPYYLQQALEARGAGAVQTLNFGMAGWTTAETLANYFLVVQDYAPDVVLIHEAVNDVEPRAWPGFRPDYSHYRRPWRDLSFSPAYRLLVRASDVFAAAQLRRADAFGLGAAVNQPPEGPFRFEGGRLPPETAAPFRRNVRTIAEHVRLRGGTPVLLTMPYDPVRAREQALFRAGLDEHNALLRELAREQSFLLVDLDELARGQAGGLHERFLDLVHLSPEGNRFKAEAVADALLAAGLVAPAASAPEAARPEPASRDAVLEAINRYRAREGRRPLAFEPRLNAAAEDRVRDMFARRYFDHVAPDGTEPYAWVRRRGYRYASAAENLATGDAAQEVVDRWMGSAAHRANLLGDFAHAGIAVALGSPKADGDGYTFVALFAAPRP